MSFTIRVTSFNKKLLCNLIEDLLDDVRFLESG